MQKPGALPVVLVSFLALALALPAAAPAQETRGVSVIERPRPDYDPRGLPFGAFTLKPELQVGGEYNDNIYATERDTTSDWIITVAPRFRLESDWPRHSLGLDAGAKAGFYASEGDENYLDAHVLAKGRADVVRGSYLQGQASFQRLHEERGDPDTTTDFDEPVVYNRAQFDALAHYGMGRAAVRVGGGYGRFDYQDVDLVAGGSLSLDHRDMDVYQVNGRLLYELLPNVVPFVSATHEWRRYDEVEPGGIDRDSNGWRVGLGTGFDLGGVTTGEVFAGYMRQDYKDSRRDDIGGLWYGATLLANVTRLTSLELQGQKSVKETTLAGASGIEALDARVRLDHELLRNLIAGAFFHFTEDDYEGVDVKDRYYTVGPRLTYLWNRYLSAGLEYAHRTKDSNVSARDYSENRFLVSVTGKL